MFTGVQKPLPLPWAREHGFTAETHPEARHDSHSALLSGRLDGHTDAKYIDDFCNIMSHCRFPKGDRSSCKCN